MHPYEGWIARRYLATALKSKRRKADPNEYFPAWTLAHGRSLGVAPLRYKSESGRGDDFDPAVKLKLNAEWRRWRLATIASAREPGPPISPLQERIEWLGQVCELTPPQQNILGLLARIARVPQVRNLVGAINKENYDSEQFDFRELRPILGPRFKQGDLSENGLLSRFGLIEKDDDDDVQITDLVGSVLSRKRLAAPQIRALLLGKPAVASLGWNDFTHLGELRDLAERMVAPRGADVPNAANILIYGPPGTGKSEFVKTLAARLGFSAHFVGEQNGKDAEPNRRERIAALMIANALGATGGKMIVVVDEADDLFAGVDEENAATRHGSKVFMNRLVERVAGPTIWIVNDSRASCPRGILTEAVFPRKLKS
jgi:transitional endoplasmic reticulum ATPase